MSICICQGLYKKFGAFYYKKSIPYLMLVLIYCYNSLRSFIFTVRIQINDWRKKDESI